MKIKSALIVTILFSVLLINNSFAGNPAKNITDLNKPVVVQNLLTGLDSDNTGLRVSSAYYLGEYQSQEAVIPLMRMFHRESNESVKIAVALSLMKIGDERGIKLIKYAADYDESAKVMNMCKKFYVHHVTGN